MDKLKRNLKKIVSMVWGLLPQKTEPNSIPVLCYHSVNEVWDDDVDPMHPRLFEEHLDFLIKYYQPISLTEWINSTFYGLDLPKNPVLITFDDGYKDNYDTVFPLVKSKNIPICIFVVTEFIKANIKLVDNQQFEAFNSAQLTEMNNSGLVSFGAHTSTHRVLSALHYDEIKVEVNSSMTDLSKWLDISFNVFAYPFGQYRHVGRDAIAVLNESNAIASFSTVWGISNPSDNRLFVPRLVIRSSDSVADLRDKLEGKYSYLSFLHKFFGAVRQYTEKLGI